MRSVLVILLSLGGLAILGGVVLAALGRAGEMTMFPGDSSPLDLDDVSAADIALLQPPMAFWGYYVPAVEETLQIIARSVADKDAEIAALRQELGALRAGHAPDAGRAGEAPEETGAWPAAPRRNDDEEVWPVPPRPVKEPPVWPEPGAGGEWLVPSESDNAAGPSTPGNDE